MKLLYALLVCSMLGLFSACGSNSDGNKPGGGSDLSGGGGQSTVVDDVSQKDIVKIASGSAAHSTLVTAVAAADLVNSLANAGPFTVFAPVNDAFDKLPKGTVEELLKPENKDKLSDILGHHVYVGVLEAPALTDGRVLNMVDLKNATIHVKDGATYIDDAKITASIRASNGVIHVIDAVVLPK